MQVMTTDEFQEIGHCGGQYTVKVKTDDDGKRTYQLGMRGSRPNPMSIVAVYALPQGIPVSMIQLGGIGIPWNQPPVEGCVPVFIASDNKGFFGHQCQDCSGYWRSAGPPATRDMTCPYCGVREPGYTFLTEGQVRYVKACCDLVHEALQSDQDGESVIDMDEVADVVGKDIEKPPFYYAEQSQQNKYECVSCGAFNDILGRYGYCSNCGTHNGHQEINKEIEKIQNYIAEEKQYETCTRDAVAAFDSFARQIVKKLIEITPMTPSRKKALERKTFHNLESSAELFESFFDIRLFKGMKKDDIDFARRMFHRRHVYEHNGGEVDEKYIQDSGDTTVRPKQVIRETQESSLRITKLILKITLNIHNGYKSIFPPINEPIEARKDHLAYLESLKKSGE